MTDHVSPISATNISAAWHCLRLNRRLRIELVRAQDPSALSHLRQSRIRFAECNEAHLIKGELIEKGRMLGSQ